MFRIVTKIPKNDISRKYQNGSFRLCKNLREYSSKGKIDKSICPPPHPKPTSSGGTGTIYTIGALALLSGGTLGLAKYNPDFRDWLIMQAPFTDDVIRFVFQEEKTYLQTLMDTLNRLKNTLLGMIGSEQSVGKVKEVPQSGAVYHPPGAAFSGLAKDAKSKEEDYMEIRLEKKCEDQEEVHVEIAGEPKRQPEVTSLDPRNLERLELKTGEATTRAINAYNSAATAIMNYNRNVEVILANSTSKVDDSVWDAIKRKAEEKSESLREAEDAETEANASMKQMRDLLNKRSLQAPPAVVERCKANMKIQAEDLQHAKKKFQQEVKSSDMTNKYWERVKDSRERFSKELHIMFPEVDLEKKKLNIREGDLDLFLMHAVSKLLFYQKQVAELETVHEARLQFAIEQARRGGAEVLTKEQICQELEKERRLLDEEYQLKCLKDKLEAEQELRQQLKLQSQAFTDHLNDALRIREEELSRTLGREFDEKLAKDRCIYKAHVAAMVGRLKGMDDAFKARAAAEKVAHQAQVLWSACQALYRALKAGCPGIPWKDQVRPLKPEITAVERAAAKEDELVTVIVKGIPPVAKDRGVYPETALRERFLKVEVVARRLALVPSEGARLHIYLLSFLQSCLLLKAPSPIPQAELSDEPVDFSNLNTNEILQRARYWLDRGDFLQCLKYMNLLKGASRVVASQWMEETRLLLETQQAANTLMAHAAASGLLYL